MEIPHEFKLLFIYKNMSRLSQDDISKIFNIVQSSDVFNQDSCQNIPDNKPIKNTNTAKNVNIKKPHIVKTQKEIKPEEDVLSSKDSDNEMDVDADIDLENKKHILILKYVNGILKNAGKEEITNLTDFVRVDREDIINDKNLKLFNDMANELFEVFDKKKCNFYYFKFKDGVIVESNKCTPLNVLRNIVKDTDLYTITTNRVDVFKNKRRKTITTYSIKLK